MQTSCSSCGARYSIADQYKGKRIKCKRCGHMFLIQSEGAKADLAAMALAASAKQPANALSTGTIPPLPISAAMPPTDAPRVIVGEPWAVVSVLFLAIAFALQVVITEQNYELLNKALSLQQSRSQSHGGTIPLREWQKNQETEYELMLMAQNIGFLSIGLLAVGIFGLIVYLFWVYQSYKNLRGLGGRSIRFSPGGAVGWHFFPLGNIWMIPKILNDLWIGSDPRGRGATTWMIPISMMFNVGSAILVFVRLAATTLGEYFGVAIAQNICVLLWGVLFSITILKIDRFQRDKLKMIQQGATASKQSMGAASV